MHETKKRILALALILSLFSLSLAFSFHPSPPPHPPQIRRKLFSPSSRRQKTSDSTHLPPPPPRPTNSSFQVAKRVVSHYRRLSPPPHTVVPLSAGGTRLCCFLVSTLNVPCYTSDYCFTKKNMNYQKSLKQTKKTQKKQDVTCCPGPTSCSVVWQTLVLCGEM